MPLLAGAADAIAPDASVPADVQTWVDAGSNGGIDVQARGDLTGHGTRDWAGVVNVTLPDDSDRWAARLVVFLQQPDGHYRLAAQSAAQPLDCGTARCEWGDLRIARHSVFVDRHFGWHGCSLDVTFQFKSKDAHWPLIGVVSDSDDTPYGLDANGKDREGPTYHVHVDHNRITGDVIATEKIGKRAARTVRAKVPPIAQDLEGFDGFTEPSNDGVPKHCGH